MTTTQSCNGGRSWAEWWRCDRILMLAALVFITVAVINPAINDSWLLQSWVCSGAVGIFSRRLFGLRRYWAQMWATTVAITISAALALRADAYGLALGWLLLAVLLAQELRR